MAKEHTFDIVSKVDMQTLKDAVNVSIKAVGSRYDLKGGKNSLELNEKDSTVTFICENDMSFRSVKEIFVQNCIKKKISTKAFEFKDPERVFSGNIKIVALVKQGLEKENCAKINIIIKEAKYKVKTQIQDSQMRVTGKDIDTLQTVIQVLQSDESFDIALQFINFR